MIVIMDNLEIRDVKILTRCPRLDLTQRLAIAVAVDHDEIIREHLPQRRGVVLRKCPLPSFQRFNGH